MATSLDRVALNPLQWFASADGWMDPSLAPPLPDRLEAVAAAGFRSIQTELPADGDLAGYARALADAGLTAGPGYGRVIWTDDSAEQAHWLESIRATAAGNAALGVEVVFFTIGMVDGTDRVKHAAVGSGFSQPHLEAVTDYLGRASRLMAAEGVLPALHPHVGSWVETEYETRFVLDNTDQATLRFGPDTGHLAWAGADPAALVRDYRDRVAGVHLKDYFPAIAERARAERLDYRSTILRGLWTEPGYGDADIDAVLRALGPDNTDWIVLEVDRGSTATPLESIQRCGSWATANFRGGPAGQPNTVPAGHPENSEDN